MFCATTSLRVRCLFELGTPLQPFAVTQDAVTGRIAIVRITPELFDFLRDAGIPLCEPTTIPPGTLAGMDILCLFRMFIGAQEPVAFAVVESDETGEISILQISDSAFELFSFLGVPKCPIITAPGVEE